MEHITGITNDVDRRLKEHESGEDKKSYTYSRRPIKLVFYADFLMLSMQLKRKNKLKSGLKEKKKR